jgi:hypothetical protein
MDDFTDEIARVQKAQARIAAASAAREKLQAARYEWARLHFSRGAVFFGKPEEFDALIDAEMKTTSGVQPSQAPRYERRCEYGCTSADNCLFKQNKASNCGVHPRRIAGVKGPEQC